MSTSDLYLNIKVWMRWINNAVISLVIFETVLVIIIGVASNNLNGSNSLWIGILIFCSVCWIVIKIIKAVYAIKFPGSVIDELIALNKLEEFEVKSKRQDWINEQINITIGSLNDQTCSTDYGGGRPDMCDENLQNRLKELMSPIIKNPNMIFNTPSISDYTVGIYIDFYLQEPASYEIPPEAGQTIIRQRVSAIEGEGIFILRDDLELYPDIVFKELFKSTGLQNLSLEIKAVMERAYNNIETSTSVIQITEKLTYTILCSALPKVCDDDDSSGVIFFIIPENVEVPSDINSVLKIFNRIAANYIYKYNDCVVNQIRYRNNAKEE